MLFENFSAPNSSALLKRSVSMDSPQVENEQMANETPVSVETNQEPKRPAPEKDEIIALVIDSAPLLKGTPLRHLAQRFCTIPEVVGEIRDKQSREYIKNLPFELELITPSEDAMKAGNATITQLYFASYARYCLT